MPASGKNRKIVKYRRRPHLNAGIVIFGAILIYLVITVVLYFTSDHVTAYEVRDGSLVKDHTYTGLILRSETIVNADGTGYVSRYVREGEKVGVKTPVYTISADRADEAEAEAKDGAEAKPDSDDLNRIQLIMENFSSHFDASSYADTYDFKYDMETRLLEMASEKLLGGEKKEAAPGLDINYAPRDGVIVYSVDGMESLKAKDVTADQTDPSKYEKTDLRSGELVQAGDPVYKLITSEKWSIVVKLDKDTADKLKDEENVTVRFLEDDTSAKAGVSLMEKDGKQYAVLSLGNSMVRFAAERYVDVELELDNASGLKIPKSAVVEKDFFIVPKEYLTKSGNSQGFLVETAGEGGGAEAKFAAADVYEETDDEVYVDTLVFSEGDVLLKPDSNDRYILGDKKSLRGVYNVNKGYAVFKKINVVAESDEYCIVEKGTDYGLARYDHIALDGTAVSDEDFIQ